MANVYYLRRAQHKETHWQRQCMYAVLCIPPLLHQLHGIAKQTWYSYDSVAASSLEQLRRWWDLLSLAQPPACIKRRNEQATLSTTSFIVVSKVKRELNKLSSYRVTNDRRKVLQVK